MKTLLPKQTLCDEFSHIKSSNIKAIGVIEDDLIVWFVKGSIYLYGGASEHFKTMMLSDSKGKYFHKHIKPLKVFYKVCSYVNCLEPASHGDFCKLHAPLTDTEE